MKKLSLKLLATLVGLLCFLPSFADGSFTITFKKSPMYTLTPNTPLEIAKVVDGITPEGVNVTGLNSTGSVAPFCGFGCGLWFANAGTNKVEITLNNSYKFTKVSGEIFVAKVASDNSFVINGQSFDISSLSTSPQSVDLGAFSSSEETNMIVLEGYRVKINSLTFYYEDGNGGGETKQDPNLSFTPEAVSYTMGESEYPVLNKPEDLSLSDFTWTSSNTEIATVENGVVTPLKAGTFDEVTISAELKDNEKYSDDKASYTIRFWKGSTSIYFAQGSVDMTFGDEVPANPLTNVNNVPVTYRSSNEEVATVNAEGIVNALKAGTTTIYATPTDEVSNLWDGVYEQSYTLNVAAAQTEEPAAKPVIENEPTSALYQGYVLTLATETADATISYKVVYTDNETDTPDFAAVEELNGEAGTSKAEITVDQAGKWMWIWAVANAEGYAASEEFTSVALEVLPEAEGCINFANLQKGNVGDEFNFSSEWGTIVDEATQEEKDKATYNPTLSHTDKYGTVYTLKNVACIPGDNLWALRENDGALYVTTVPTSINGSTSPTGTHITKISVHSYVGWDGGKFYWSENTPLNSENYTTGNEAMFEDVVLATRASGTSTNHVWNNGNKKVQYIYIPGTGHRFHNMDIEWANDDENTQTGVETIEVENGEAVYFNLQGVRVANPEKGVYVKVQNGNASKVIL